MSAKLKISVAALAAFVAAPAFAADMIESAPEAPAPVYEEPVANWSGGYVGGNIGGSFAGRAKDKRANNSVNTDGISGSVFGGYQQQMDSGVVLGAEGELGLSGVRGDNAGTRAKVGPEGSLRARVGYAATPNLMPYVTAGGAGRQLKVTEGGVKDKNTQLGWTAGAGVDAKVTEQVFVRGEYRYSDFGSDNFTTGSGPRKVSGTDHRATLGVGVKF